MATATEGRSLKDMAIYARENVEKSPKEILEIVLAETQRAISQERVKTREALDLAAVDFSPAGGLVPKNMAGLWQMAIKYAESDFVPASFRGSPGNCMIAIEWALRCQVPILAFMQKCYIVPGSGKPAIETPLAIAMANKSGIFVGRFNYKYEGEGAKRKCTCSAIIKETGEVVEKTISMELARSMGWIDKKGSFWVTMPDQMLEYRSGMWLLRSFAPEVLMGMYSVDEVADMPEDKPDAAPAKPVNNLDALADHLMNGGHPANGAETNGAHAETAPAATEEVKPVEETTAPESETKPEEFIADDNVIRTFESRIGEAGTAMELQQVAGDLKAVKMSDAQRDALRSLWAKRQKELK